MILYSLLPFYKKERINYNSEIEQNKVAYKKILTELEEKRKIAIETAKNEDNIPRKERKQKVRQIKVFFSKEIKELKRKYKESNIQAKINFMAAVSRNKELKENIKLMKKSKSNLHRVLYDYSKLPYAEKKNSLVVQELSPSKEVQFSIKKRVFNDLDTYGNTAGDRIFASDKDILFTTFQSDKGSEKIPMILRYSGQCVPIFLDKIRDDTYDKFSNENEHHLEVLCARFRETKAPSNGFKMNRTVGMIILGVVLFMIYLAYKYYKGGG